MTTENEAYWQWRSDYESDYDKKPTYFECWQAATAINAERIKELENQIRFLSSALAEANAEIERLQHKQDRRG